MSNKMNKLELWKYIGKNVKIKDKEGYIWIGKVTEYTPAIDSDKEIERIDVVVSKDGNEKFHTNGCYEFTENEIAEIEEIN